LIKKLKKKKKSRLRSLLLRFAAPRSLDLTLTRNDIKKINQTSPCRRWRTPRT
jgi:hypothetical protein